MKVLILEDEKYAQEKIKQLLLELNPNIIIAKIIDSVKEAESWLKANQVDLILMDIHLSDDICFSIFDHVSVTSPIIFTTAYDQYSLQAFKVFSVDYLLKPIDKEELRLALEKFHRFNPLSQENILQIKELITSKSEKVYQKRFLVKKRDKIFSIKIEDIAYFEAEDRYVSLIKKDGKKYFIDYKLSELEEILDPNLYFRLNRSFISNISSIDQIISLSKSKMKITLKPITSRDVIISSEKSRSFKNWLNQ